MQALIGLPIQMFQLYNIYIFVKTKVSRRNMEPKTTVKQKGLKCDCVGHSEFEEIISMIKKKGNFQECLETAEDLYGIKKYNILEMNPRKIAQLYDSICNRVYINQIRDHQDFWVGYELKIFVWLVVCHLCAQISSPERIQPEVWQKYSRIFHNKNVDLIQYQARLINGSQTHSRKWEKNEENLLVEIMKSTQQRSKWNEAAKNLYLRSEKRFFRNPKQIREHWMNHLDPQISKSEWTPEEDYIIVNTVLQNGRKWALAAKLAGGKRTEHMIKNRYHTLLRYEEKIGVHSSDKDKVLRAIRKKLQPLIKKEQLLLMQQKSPKQEGVENMKVQHMNMEDQVGLQINGQQQKQGNKESAKDLEQENIHRYEEIAQFDINHWMQKEEIVKKHEEQQFLSILDFEGDRDIIGPHQALDRII